MKILKQTIAICLVLSTIGCMPFRSNPNSKQKQKIEGQAGRIIPAVSLSIDGNYESRLDNVITGYKLLSVIVKNMSLRNVEMDAKRDRWTIVGEKGRRYKAINTLRYRDPVQWRELPEKMQMLIDYPEIIPINYGVTFDLLLPKNAKLDYFKEIRYYNAAWGQEFVLEKEY